MPQNALLNAPCTDVPSCQVPLIIVITYHLFVVAFCIIANLAYVAAYFFI